VRGRLGRAAPPAKLLARERVEVLVDPGAAFLSCPPWPEGLYDDQAPSAGIVTGIAPVAGTPCVMSPTTPR
jgi:3-methylcrotonyl-CoA carboxylase beta subunit